MSATTRKLNLGCGESLRKGYVNVDWHAATGADIVHNLNDFPYPFENNSFEEIVAFHVLEHLDRPFDVMRELHRLLVPHGTLYLKVPHFSRGFTHAEHRHGFDLSFPKYFDSTFSRSGYFGVDYELQKCELHWLAFFDLMPHYGYGPTFIRVLKSINWFISGLANINAHLCSRIWCFWIGGFDEIEFEFKAIKSLHSEISTRGG